MPFVLMAFWLAWSELGSINLFPSQHLPPPQNWLFKEKLGKGTQTRKPKPVRRWDRVANFPSNWRLCSSPPATFTSGVRLTKFKERQLENGLQVRCWPHRILMSLPKLLLTWMLLGAQYCCGTKRWEYHEEGLSRSSGGRWGVQKG